MIEDKKAQAGWVSSLDIIEKTGISRATLNNYIKMNLLPRPKVRKPDETAVRARMLGYFPASVMDTIGQIKILKNHGSTMNVIIERLKRSNSIEPSGDVMMREESRSSYATGPGISNPNEQNGSSVMPEERKGTLTLASHEIKPPREAACFVHPKLDDSARNAADLLSRRTKIINDLLGRPMPTLISFCVLVADLQNSARICAELPPEEYFELINQVWICVDGSFKQYYGAHGKHAGNGMLYYFLKEQDNQHMMNAVLCALEIRENIKKLNTEWKVRKGWFNELKLNIGINEGEEYFGTISNAPGAEFVSLGDTVNHAGRLSDFARCGAIWTTKNLINKLGAEEKNGIRYGIRHIDKDNEVLVEDSFSRIMDIMTPDNIKNSRLMDIATLAITEILGRR
ncbi:MAG: hypothetical protein C0394_02380 [Syntrophus sp. (in: bacteria)]|nr:hypothetical protein [Syntrophus sp. (in: bacteria)]